MSDKVPTKAASVEKVHDDVQSDHEAQHLGLVNPEDGVDPAYTRRVMRKVDFRLVPILAGLYAFSLIDRTNISLARVIGMGKELHLEIGARYSIATVVFFLPYIILELPSNLAMRRVGAALWLGSIAVLWGVVMIAMGFVHSWQALTGCRALVGVLEAGFYPGCVYLITTWYIRREQQARLAFFYLFSILLAGLSPIFAYGVSTIGEAYGLLAWRWLFIICGCITSFLGLLSYFLIVDFPDKAKFLTPDEIAYVRARIEYDRGDSVHDQLDWAKFRIYAADLKLWAFSLLYLCSTLATYAYSFFLPVIMAGMNFSTKDSQLLIAPPYAFSVVFGIISALISDRVGKRGPFIIFQALCVVVGLAMTAFLKGTAGRYAGAFLGMYGCQSNIPAVMAYCHNNIVGQSKRSFASALIIGGGGIGGIIASVVFRQQDAPKYVPGIWSAIAAHILIIIVVSSLMISFSLSNARVRRGVGPPIEGRPGFFYTL